jgi:hypothetical protein
MLGDELSEADIQLSYVESLPAVGPVVRGTRTSRRRSGGSKPGQRTGSQSNRRGLRVG